ncbi:MAG TPA: methyltransferase domain-containing protein [Solirubrobacteraceae bacterium]|nr:methyltransferase domain-containing protein [Solirubrobacteraceae bacterium]
MPSIDSEQAGATPRYDFTFAWNSAYGHVVELVQRLDIERGLIVDLGCGTGTIAQPLTELGFEYVGADIDPDSLAELAGRGLDGRYLDLGDLEQLPEAIRELTDGRPVAAVLLLDVVEHMPETRPFLEALRRGLDAIDRPHLLISVPNIAHVDVAAKLVFGRWDYTPTGLLDSTHVQFFTADRLGRETRACGLVELAAHDFTMRNSDQHFPSEHPAVSWASPVAAAIRIWRESADRHADTIQFVRAFLPSPRASEATDLSVPATLEREPGARAAREPAVRALTVVMRTQGRRPTHLRDALTCLAAQSVENFDVAVMLHTPNPEETLPSVEALVAEFDATFSGRVAVLPVIGGGRARPLNAALDRLSSDYVAFLDDDDVVTADWVERFIEAAGDGAIVRSVAALRRVSPSDESHRAPFVVQSGLEFPYTAKFDVIRHLFENETPICTFAVPRYLIETFRLRFDEQLPILEDWDFLMRCVALAPVRDTEKVTSVYQMWRGGESSASLHEAEVWRGAQRVLQERRNAQPVLLPAGSADRLVKLCERLIELEARDVVISELEEDLHMHGAASKEHAEARVRLEAEVGRLQGELANVNHAYAVTVQSRRWRTLSPLARAAAAARDPGRALARLLRAGRGG